jgi:hypothetical protein
MAQMKLNHASRNGSARTACNYLPCSPSMRTQAVVLSATEEDAVVNHYGHDPLATLTHVIIDDLLLCLIPGGNAYNIEQVGLSVSHTQHR